MKKLAIALALGLCFMLGACGGLSRLEAHYTGYSSICVDHVNYLQFTSGATVQVDKSGMPVSCN
jgi:hypothetical protein